MKKSRVKVAIAVAAVLILAVLAIPLFINAESLRPTVEAQLTRAFGRKVTIGHLSFSIFSGSLGADDIQIADDPAFSTAPFIKARSLAIGVEISPLIFSREVRVTNLTIDTPAIQLIKGAKGGTWNFSSFGSATPSNSSQSPATPPDLAVAELKIEKGSATVSSLAPHAKPSVYSNVNLSVQKFSFTSSFPFELAADLPANGHFSLKGTAGPISQKDAADTPFQATLNLKTFDIVASGAVDPRQGISMLLDVDAQLGSDGSTLTNTGKIKALHLHLARTGHPANDPVDIDYSLTTNLATEAGAVNDIALHAGSIAAHVKGTYQINPDGAVLDLHLSAPGLPVDEVERLLPAVGITLPSGSSLHGGTINASLTITGPDSGPTIVGPVELSNSKLAGFDLGSRIGGINPFGSSGGGTAIQKLRAEVNNSPSGTRLSNIDVDIPQIGTATGNGSVSSSEELDFRLMAKFNPNSGVGMVAGKALGAVTTGTSQAVGLLGKALNKNKPAAPSSAGEIPITITGTTSNPNIKANVVAMFK
jgi:AsmA protein